MTTISSQSEGDTQPISQRVYDEFMSNTKLQTPMKNVPQVSGETGDTTDLSLHSYHQGQSGFVDLVGPLEEPSRTDAEVRSPENEDDDGDPLSPIVDIRAEPYPESKRFRQPKTPATSGKKRNHAGEIIQQGDSTSKLPINPFAGHMHGLDTMMNQSQAFNATQAVSSPLTHVLRSDSLSERPSPDMFEVRRPATAGLFSSSPQTVGLNKVRAVTEPQTTYISMQESQERRELAMRPPLEVPSSTIVSSDEDFESDSSERRRRRNRKQIDRKGKDKLTSVTASRRLASRGRDRRIQRNRDRRELKYQSGREASEPVVISDDLRAEGNETEHENHEDLHADEIDELADDNKENVEVPMTISRPNQRKSPAIGSQSSPLRAPQTNVVSSSAKRSQSRKTTDGGMDVSTKPSDVPEGTQISAIADSQPPPNIEKTWQQSANHPPASSASEILVPRSQALPVFTTSQLKLPFEKSKVADNTPTIGFETRVLSNESPISSPVESQKRYSPLVEPQGLSSSTTRAIAQVNSSPKDISLPRQTSTNASILNRQEGRVLDVSENSKIPDELMRVTKGPTEAMKSIARSSPGKIVSTLPSTIPETNSIAKNLAQFSGLTGSSDAMQNFSSNGKSTLKARSESLQHHVSTGSTPFETAQTNLLNSSSKRQSVDPKLPSSHRVLSPGPKSPPSKTLAQIAADPSPFDAIGEVDVSVNLLSSDDYEFQNVINGSSPLESNSKRRRAKGRDFQIVRSEPETALDPAPELQPDVATEPAPETSVFAALDTNKKVSSSKNIQDALSTDELAFDYSVLEKEISKDKLAPLTSRVLDDKPPVSTPLKSKSSPLGRPRKVQLLTKAVDTHTMSGNDGKSGSAARKSHLKNARIPAKSVGKALSSGNIIAPDRVFAHFNGNYKGYYPATGVGVVDNRETQYKVTFDDGTDDLIPSCNVSRLELRLGDNIKVEGAGNRIYTVQGFADLRLPSALPDSETPSKRQNGGKNSYTDVYGHAAVIVKPKQPQLADGELVEEISFPLKDIYLTNTMWAKYKDRTFNPILSGLLVRLQTPSSRPSIPSAPSSRSRRTKNSASDNPRSATARPSTGVGLFVNMVFAITNISSDKIRRSTMQQILSNGGRIVADGFNELFDIPPLELASSPRNEPQAEFHLTQEAQGIGFACLIADGHCRMAKYVQALALGIPCVATRWVNDCISKQCIQPWEPYLLPAGKSEYLDQAIRSRVLQSSNPNQVTLLHVVANRPKMLDGGSVLLIMSKAEEDTMKYYPFITHALGASKVSRALSLDAAAKAIAKAQADGEEPWDWVYTHNDEDRELVEERLSRLNTSNKRQRDSGYGIGKMRTRVVCNEFVIQSLILGQLMDT